MDTKQKDFLAGVASVLDPTGTLASRHLASIETPDYWEVLELHLSGLKARKKRTSDPNEDRQDLTDRDWANLEEVLRAHAGLIRYRAVNASGAPQARRSIGQTLWMALVILATLIGLATVAVQTVWMVPR